MQMDARRRPLPRRPGHGWCRPPTTVGCLFSLLPFFAHAGGPPPNTACPLAKRSGPPPTEEPTCSTTCAALVPFRYSTPGEQAAGAGGRPLLLPENSGGSGRTARRGWCGARGGAAQLRSDQRDWAASGHLPRMASTPWARGGRGSSAAFGGSLSPERSALPPRPRPASAAELGRPCTNSATAWRPHWRPTDRQPWAWRAPPVSPCARRMAAMRTPLRRIVIPLTPAEVRPHARHEWPANRRMCWPPLPVGLLSIRRGRTGWRARGRSARQEAAAAYSLTSHQRNHRRGR